MVGPAGEGVEAEGPEQQREYLRIARIFGKMLFGRGHRLLALALDRRCDDLDVLALARGRGRRELPRIAGLGAGRGAFHVELMDAGAARWASAKSGSSAIAASNAASAPCNAASIRSTPST